ncbi:DUF4169 family protein [Roseomonas sp. OT10]|uniref:DUF4169 family protein n=1 Tax=Roseomonas cutis TaxID=2897332 RepID=UPI001E489506|nr:DUF4169 family protein [Roseomonas sp. OT10]UFN50889.1 DUF4169 family protein [Roseomonas sp. OT10]
MAEIVNLRLHRKRQDRQAAAEQAAANRAKHGRTRAEKEQDRMAEARRHAMLDGARLDDAGPERDGS